MKQKLLLILSFMLVTLGLQAEEYSYTFTKTGTLFAKNETKTLNGVEWTLDGDGGYWSWDNNSNKGEQLGSSSKPFKSMTLSTSGIPGTITKIVLNTSGGSKINATATITVGGNKFGDKITLTTDPTDYTFSGSASGKIVISYTQTTSKAIYIKSITVTYTQAENVPPTKPALTSSCKFLEEQEVVISCATEDAKIYYTTDGTNPTAESKEYTEPFTVAETTTVKAIAVNENGSSEVAEATYTKTELISIAEVVAAGVQSDAVATSGTVVATYAQGFLIGDNTDYILVYLNKKSDLVVGDVVTVLGATSTYGGLLQFGNTSTYKKTGTAEVSLPEPEVLDGAAMDALVAKPVIKYVQYTGTLNISGNYYNVNVAGTSKAVGSIQYPNEGLVNAALNGKEVTVTGFVVGVSSSKYLNTMAVSVVESHVHSASKFTVEGASIKAACECEESCGSLTLVLPSDLVYNGQAKAVTVEGAIEGVETPEVVYSSEAAPVNAGTYTASITLGDVTATVEYTIAAKSIEGAVAGEFAEMTYTGEAQTPVAVVTLDGVEVTGTWSEVTNVGDKSTFTANGNFTGSLEAEVGMKAKELEESDIVLEAETVEYTGEAIEPVVTVTSGDATLVEGTDYVVTYNNNVEVGEATITVTAMGNYSGTFVVKFVITQPTTIAPVQSQTEVVYYDLCGRRVQQPLKGKIYIANGKKVIF